MLLKYFILKLEAAIIRVINYKGTHVFIQDGVKTRVIKIHVYLNTHVPKYPCILITIYVNTRAFKYL